MALNGLICADVSLSSYSLTHATALPVITAAFASRLQSRQSGRLGPSNRALGAIYQLLAQKPTANIQQHLTPYALGKLRVK